MLDQQPRSQQIPRSLREHPYGLDSGWRRVHRWNRNGILTGRPSRHSLCSRSSQSRNLDRRYLMRSLSWHRQGLQSRHLFRCPTSGRSRCVLHVHCSFSSGTRTSCPKCKKLHRQQGILKESWTTSYLQRFRLQDRNNLRKSAKEQKRCRIIIRCMLAI